MPAYFSVDFQYKKADICSLSGIYSSLLDCGLKFKRGYYNAQNDSWDEIVAWNQSKFDDDFELGYTEHFSHDYRQMLFDYFDFSEVRFYVSNIQGEGVFSCHLIIPEDDLIEYTESYNVIRQEGKMKLLEEFAMNMWARGNIACVQTGWECSDCATPISEINKGAEPLIEPFAIIPKALYREEWDCTKKEIDEKSVILYCEENWSYV